jgi:hypothetical protein
MCAYGCLKCSPEKFEGNFCQRRNYTFMFSENKNCVHFTLPTWWQRRNKSLWSSVK